MLPYILSELSDLSSAREAEPHGRRCAAPGYCNDVADLLDELLMYRAAARPRTGVLRLVDAGQPHANAHGLLQGAGSGGLRRRGSYPGRPNILHLLQKELGELARADGVDAKTGFVVNVDVRDYRPEELTVQVTKDDGFVVVEGSHEERADEHGLVRRQFTRRYKLPNGVDPDAVTSRLTAEGVLQVSAPAKDLPAVKDRVRHVPIACGKQPTLQQHPEEEEKEKAPAAKEQEPDAKSDAQ